jgi:beta propeller repeat protein
MKSLRTGFSNVLVFVFLAGLIVGLIALFSSQRLGGGGPNVSPMATPTIAGAQASPLSTPVPVGTSSIKVGIPALLTNARQASVIKEDQGKFLGIVGKGNAAHSVWVDLNSGEEHPLADRILPYAQVSGDWLVYLEESNLTELTHTRRIKIRDLKTQLEIALGNEDNIQSNPDISGNIVVWDDARNGNKSAAGIYAYNLKTSKELPVIVGQPEIGYPRISGEWIVYLHFAAERASTVELRAHSLKTGEDFSIGLVPNPQDSWFGTHYVIDGDKVAWTKYEPSQYMGELHLHDLKNRTDRQLTEPNNFPPAGLSMSAKNGVIVYNDAGKRVVLDWLQQIPTPVSVPAPIASEWGYELSAAGDYLVWEIPLNREASEDRIYVAKLTRQ